MCRIFFSLTNKQLVRLFGSLDSVGIQGACGFSFVICIYLLKTEKRKFNYTGRRNPYKILSCPSDPQSKCVLKYQMCDGRKQMECTKR